MIKKQAEVDSRVLINLIRSATPKQHIPGHLVPGNQTLLKQFYANVQDLFLQQNIATV